MARPRQVKTYFDHVDPMQRFSDRKFIERYRLSKALVRQIADDYVQLGYCSTNLTSKGAGLTANERVCLALRYFATGANFSIIGDFQGVSKSTVSHCVKEVAHFLYCEQQTYIHFPNTRQERYQKAADFHDNFDGKPLCIGAIDGTHIPILSPRDEQLTFVNRKHYHSLNVMGICDADLLFTHIDPTKAGSSHDAYVLRMSAIGAAGEGGEFEDHYLLGDSGYPLKPYLFTPVRAPQTREHHRYNRWHIHTRSTIERTFGIWKQRFRCLDNSGGYLYHAPIKCGQIITACACLHNIARLNNMPPPIHEEGEDVDGYRGERQPRIAPADIVYPEQQRQHGFDARALFINTQFAR